MCGIEDSEWTVMSAVALATCIATPTATMLLAAAEREAVHDDVIKWEHFPRHWPFVREIHRSPVNYRHKGQWCGALVFSLICAWINGWVNNRGAGDLRCHHAHYDVTVMKVVLGHHWSNMEMTRQTFGQQHLLWFKIERPWKTNVYLQSFVLELKLTH